MPTTDLELRNGARAIQQFQQSAASHQAAMSDILDKYAQLIEDHKRLQSDYEEERDARERYK